MIGLLIYIIDSPPGNPLLDNRSRLWQNANRVLSALQIQPHSN